MNHLVPLKQKTWKDHEVKSLIQAYKLHVDDFSNHTIKVLDVWNSISDELKKQGVNKSGVECDKKWRNLKSAFKKIYCDEERTEESKYQWDFYEELLEVMLSDKQLRRAAPIVPSSMLKTNQSNSKNSSFASVTHIYSVEHTNDREDNIIENNSENIYVELQPPAKRIHVDQKESEEQIVNLYQLTNEEVNHDELIERNSEIFETIETLESEIPEETENVMSNKIDLGFVDESEPPLWFQKSFLIKYETDVKLIKDKLNKISECQELQNTMLEHMSNRISKIEWRLNSVNNKK
uniref:CSON005055 protein n=1 Tax=Culicoides sonorensis TaxID=179676 RepID=A0A336MSH5_CULSO